MSRGRAALGAVAVAVLTVLASGCASMKFTDWTGHRIDEVITQFGAPTRITPTSDGGKFYVFEYVHSISEPSWGPSGAVVTTERRCTASRSFMVRSDGIVASWNQTECQP